MTDKVYEKTHIKQITSTWCASQCIISRSCKTGRTKQQIQPLKDSYNVLAFSLQFKCPETTFTIIPKVILKENSKSTSRITPIHVKDGQLQDKLVKLKVESVILKCNIYIVFNIVKRSRYDFISCQYVLN